MSGERGLIVNADDFGRSPGINAAIVDCHLGGIVTSTTLMVNLQWTADAVDRLSDCPRLGVGLHLNFCYGEPVSSRDDVPGLVDADGVFVADTSWLSQHADETEILIESRAQVECFGQFVGRMPTHLDSHKYLHSTARFRRPVIQLAKESGLPVRAVTDDDRFAIRQAGIPAPDRFEGRFHGLDGAGVSMSILSRALADVGPGVTELMCHPGYVDKHIRDSSYTPDREREAALLRDERIRQAVSVLGIRLMTFAEI